MMERSKGICPLCGLNYRRLGLSVKAHFQANHPRQVIQSVCPFCGLDTRGFWLTLKDHVRTRHAEQRPVHRVYNITSPKRLRKFLNLLRVELKDIGSHPHYQELTGLSEGKTIGWKTDFGQTIEKLVHILVDTHVAPCTKDQCFEFDLSINFSDKWTAYTIDSCAKCNSNHPTRPTFDRSLDGSSPHLKALRLAKTKGPKEIWHLEHFDTWIPERYSKSLSVRHVSLVVDPLGLWTLSPHSWMRPILHGGEEVRRCGVCGRCRLDKPTYSSGPWFALVAHMYAKTCVCTFNCLWAL